MAVRREPVRIQIDGFSLSDALRRDYEEAARFNAAVRRRNRAYKAGRRVLLVAVVLAVIMLALTVKAFAASPCIVECQPPPTCMDPEHPRPITCGPR